jgi:hypothetical protein
MEAPVPPVTDPASLGAQADAPLSSDAAPVPEPAPPASAPEAPNEAGPTDAVTAPEPGEQPVAAQRTATPSADVPAGDDAPADEPASRVSAPEAPHDR